MAHRNRWLTYILERFPLSTYLLLSVCMCWSGAALYQMSPFSIPIQTGIALFGLVLFFFELRLMDELKDLEKDRLAHPSRPLPRGLIHAPEARRVISGLLLAMLIFSLVLWAARYRDGALLYTGVTGYLALMYKEFFVGAKLSRLPFLYGFTHQIILVPLVAFPIAIYHNHAWLMTPSWELGLTVLGAFFTYELCRKLDPSAHPVLRTYPQVYGRGGTLFRITLTSAIALLGSSLLHIELVCAPPVILTWIAAVIWVQRPRCHKWVEALATLSLLVHLACVPIFRLVSKWI